MRSLLVPLILLAAATPAMADERTGYMSIAAGDLKRAEATLERARRADPDRAEVLLNLAAVYQQTGRSEAARQLYATVLSAEPVAMDMPSGAVLSSHAVAQRGLAKLGPTMMAAR